ncbi:MAG: bifunctional UDP-sugar hydrolase/5'-nucleotidase [Cetobacterium sp.]|uniref:bifunctional metallophosphatase/5'-nucleotidase n=1 Tax=Cetobacterium sp. TaxID=2071632 RepID=UPI002FC86707
MKSNNNTFYDFTFIHLNDIHGRVNGENNSINFSKLFTFLEALRKDKNNGKIFLIDSGDTLHGTPFANLSKGESIVALFNYLKFDYTTIGNHDFNYGYSHLKTLLSLQNYKTLALNLIDKQSKNEDVKPFDIVSINGINICFFGIITPETYYKTNSNNIKGLDIIDPEVAVKNLLKTLEKEEIDLYVGITHLGCDKSTKEIYQSSYLAKKFSEINIIFDGHSHTEIKEQCLINNTLISQTGSYNNKIALIQVKIKRESKTPIFNYKLISKDDIDYYKNDPAIKDKIENILKNQALIMNTVIGQSKYPLIGDRNLVRCQETNFTQLITDAILWKTDCDAVLINGGSIRDSITAGNITIGDIMKSIPFGNFIVTKKIQGTHLKTALENGLKAYPEPLGAMAQTAGMKVFFNPNNPPLKRVDDIYIQNNLLSLDSYYNVAMTDFMALGGEEYSSFIDGEEIEHYPSVENIVIEYIKFFGIKVKESIVSRIISKYN